MTNALTRPEIEKGAIAEYRAFADLLDQLGDDAWTAPSRCDGFEARDVAGHVVGLAEDVARGVPGSRTAAEEAASLRDYDQHEVAKHLREAVDVIVSFVEALDDAAWNGPSPVDGLTLGQAVVLLWYDAYVHADDIRAAAGMPTERGPGLRASVEYLGRELTTRGWGPARLELDGLSPIAIGEGGPTVRGDAHEFVLAATGRTDPAPLGLDATVNIYAE
jgi:uncharacterized protein (TIGR03083 family)